MYTLFIICLCTIFSDGSVDAERSIVTDLVGQMDPPGKLILYLHVVPYDYTAGCLIISYTTRCMYDHQM